MINFFGFDMSEINITSSLHVWRMTSSGSSEGLRASHQDTDVPSVSPRSLHPGEICCRPSLCSSLHNVPFSSGPYSTLSRLVLTNLLTVCIDLSLHFLSLLQWASGICRWSFSQKLENWGPLFLKMAFMFPPLPSFSRLPITRADTWFFFFPSRIRMPWVSPLSCTLCSGEILLPRRWVLCCFLLWCLVSSSRSASVISSSALGFPFPGV